MTKAELIERVAVATDVTKKQAESIVDTVFEAIVRSLKEGQKIELRGFGSFRLRERGARMGRNYYWFPVFLPEDDRSGRYVGGTLAYYYFLKEQTGYIQARFSYTHDFTSGENWENNSYSISLSSLYPITPGLRVRGFVDVTLQQYVYDFFNGNPVETNAPRKDKILIAGLEITKDIYKGLEFNAHYYFIRDDSNVSIYDYSRHIVGCQLGYRY